MKAAQVNALICLMRPLGLIDPDQGIATINQAVNVSKSLDDPLLLARTQAVAAGVRLLYDKWRKEDAELCSSALQMIHHPGDSGTPPYHRLIFAHVQALEGRYGEALDGFEAFIPKLDEPSSLMAYFFALSGKTVALLYLGQFGEVLRILQAGREMTRKNGSDIWLFNFREAWLRTFALDFAGARLLCESITRAGAHYPTGQPETIARIAAGYAELDRENYDGAIDYFRRVGDTQITPKFFWHWFWRITARLGLSRVWLESGDLANARAEAEAALASALSTADPYLQALAWETRSRVALADRDWNGATAYVDQALAVLREFDVPVAAWQVHATAWDVHLDQRDDTLAETHRARAESHILAIANSFAPEEPLRKSFLGAAPIRRILSKQEPGAGRLHCDSTSSAHAASHSPMPAHERDHRTDRKCDAALRPKTPLALNREARRPRLDARVLHPREPHARGRLRPPRGLNRYALTAI
jgi:tetratricopeptide (TPR) repeat protein